MGNSLPNLPPAPLIGDSNGDGVFDQPDLTAALARGKYLTGQPATWVDGDWNGDEVLDTLEFLALQERIYAS